MYAIRCEALNFKLSKSQKKVLKRVNRYLITGQKPGGKEAAEAVAAEGPGGDTFVQRKKSELSLSASDLKNDRTGSGSVAEMPEAEPALQEKTAKDDSDSPSSLTGSQGGTAKKGVDTLKSAPAQGACILNISVRVFSVSSLSLCVSVSVSLSLSVSFHVCLHFALVCVCEREREKERERDKECVGLLVVAFLFHCL